MSRKRAHAVRVTPEEGAGFEDSEFLFGHLMLYQIEGDRKQLRLKRPFNLKKKKKSLLSPLK